MHYLLEIIIPNSENLEKDIEELLTPFCEHDVENSHTFYDWYQLGGRYSGRKLLSKLDPDKLKSFREKLVEMNTTVNGITFGKQDLDPKEQIPIVDKLWQETFPESGIIQCPIFKHYEGTNADIEDLKDVSKNAECSLLLIGNKTADRIESLFLIQDEIWNGVTWVKTIWNGNILEGVEMFKKSMENYNQEYIKENTPKDDWKVITVDIHS